LFGRKGGGICNVAVGSGVFPFRPLAKFFVPDWGEIVDSGIGLPYRPAKLHRLAGNAPGMYRNPMPESTISPSQETKDLASVRSKGRENR
jgi:hypothetical protein